MAVVSCGLNIICTFLILAKHSDAKVLYQALKIFHTLGVVMMMTMVVTTVSMSSSIAEHS